MKKGKKNEKKIKIGKEKEKNTINVGRQKCESFEMYVTKNKKFLLLRHVLSDCK